MDTQSLAQRLPEAVTQFRVRSFAPPLSRSADAAPPQRLASPRSPRARARAHTASGGVVDAEQTGHGADELLLGGAALVAGTAAEPATPK